MVEVYQDEMRVGRQAERGRDAHLAAAAARGGQDVARVRAVTAAARRREEADAAERRCIPLLLFKLLCRAEDCFSHIHLLSFALCAECVRLTGLGYSLL